MINQIDISLLRKALSTFNNYVANLNLSDNELYDYWAASHSLINGFNIVSNDTPQKREELTASLCLRLFNLLQNKNYQNSGTILTLCRLIFYQVYGREISDENRAPNMIDFFINTREPKSRVDMVLVALCSGIVFIYELINFGLTGHWPSVSELWKNNFYPFLGILLTLLLAENFMSSMTKIIRIVEWRMHWYRFHFPSKLKYHWTNIKLFIG